MKTRQLFCLLLLSAAAGGALAETAPNDPHYGATGSWGQDFADQWALRKQRVYTDVSPTPENSAVIVAVIDTGLDYTHEDIAADKIWRNAAEKNNGRDDDGNGYVDDLIGWNFVEHNNNPWDHSGHGTHIAGIIAACTNNGIGIAGANPHARIMPLKVANFTGQAKSANVAAAIYYAVDHGARIINLSLGGELVTDMEVKAASYARDHDVLIVVSAGNRGARADQQGYPTLPGVLVVGASDLTGQRAGFSNFGPNVAILAPGVDVLSLRAHDSDFIALSDPLDYPDESAVVGAAENYYRASGTSFSAALTSGIASRVLALRPEYSSADLQSTLQQSAVDVAPAGVDQLSGYGEIDFIAALGRHAKDAVEARLISAELELADAQLWINVKGTARAGNFDGAKLQLRAAPNSIPVAVPDEDDRRKKRKNKKKKKKREDAVVEPSPYDWQTVTSITEPVESSVLARLDLNTLSSLTGGSTHWELRLMVSSLGGNRRDAIMSLSMPAPEPVVVPDREVPGE